MKVITDYFSSPHSNNLTSESRTPLSNGKRYSSENEVSENNSEVYYEYRKIKIRLADPAVPDSYICEVYDTSLEESIDDDVPLTKVAEKLSKRESKTDKPEEVQNEVKPKGNPTGKVLGERNMEVLEEDISDDTAGKRRRVCTRVKRPVVLVKEETAKKRSRPAKEVNNVGDKSTITGYFKRADDKNSKKKENYVSAGKEKVALAPLWLPAPKKPKIDPEVERSRRAFLHSGLPEIVKKAASKAPTIPELDFFPSVGHVQQRCDHYLWKKRPSTLRLRNELFYQNISCKPFHWNCSCTPRYSLPKVQSRKLDKRAVEKLKIAYKQVPIELILNNVMKLHSRCSVDGLKRGDIPWSEKYRPSSEGILGNEKVVELLREWLLEWKNHRVAQNGANWKDCGSSDDEETGPKPSCLLEGPVASGKTSVVYALASELDLNVIEINASSKRSGKKLIAELQEATRSHEVREETGSAVILVEDADVVFDEDEGFVAALQSLITSSKRPIILLTSDPFANHLERFRGSRSLQLKMMRPHSSAACALLELICHVEGGCPPRSTLLGLVCSNNMDLRRSLLELQFWNRTGGWEVETSQILTSDRLWWTSHERLFGKKLWRQSDEPESECMKHEKIPTKLNKEVVNFFHSLSDSDVVGGRSKVMPIGLGWNQFSARDSLSLSEDFRSSNWLAENLNRDVSSTFYKLSCPTSDKNCRQPLAERRWTELGAKAKAELEVGLPRGTGRSGAVDYLPTLRSMLRAEVEAASQSRRRSRGYHYLRGLGISLSPGSIPVISGLFNCSS